MGNGFMLFTALISISSGFLFAAITANKVKLGTRGTFLAVIICFITLSAGIVIQCFMFGHPERIANILAKPTSKLSLMIILAVINLVLMLIFILKRGKTKSILINILMIITSLACIWTIGSIYMMPAKPAWNTILMPIIYLLTSLAPGFFMVGFLHKLSGEKYSYDCLVAEILNIAVLLSVIIYIWFLNNIFYTKSFLEIVSKNSLLLFCGGVIMTLIVTLFGIFIRKKAKHTTINYLICTILALSASFMIRFAINSIKFS